MSSLEKEIDILETISRGRRRISQRDLARIIGLSLGMTNSILKRLVQKGWLQIRKVNNRNIQYIISAQGMERIARRSYRYLRRTIKNVVQYKEAIADLAREASLKGYEAVVLVGDSDLDFIVEHVCIRNRLRFIRVDSVKEAEGARRVDNRRFLLFSESFSGVEPQQKRENRAYLGRLLGKMHSSKGSYT
jgi:DNA-binding MarR family transcriptional regulator